MGSFGLNAHRYFLLSQLINSYILQFWLISQLAGFYFSSRFLLEGFMGTQFFSSTSFWLIFLLTLRCALFLYLQRNSFSMRIISRTPHLQSRQYQTWSQSPLAVQDTQGPLESYKFQFENSVWIWVHAWWILIICIAIPQTSRISLTNFQMLYFQSIHELAITC